MVPGGHLGILSTNGEPLLGGIQVTMLDELQQYGYSSFLLANPLKVLIRSPGHVEVSTRGIALVYQAGNIREEKLLQHADVMQALAKAVAVELTGQTTGTIESVEDVFNDLAKAIVRLGHGGLLLVTKHPDMDQFSSPRQLLDCSLLRRLLVRYWDTVAKALAASDGVGNLLAEENQHDTSPHLLTLASDTTMLENCVRSIAHLAGVDGAIVMDYACNLVAFNAIIAKDTEKKEQARLVDSNYRGMSEEEVVGSHGSRHQSAVAYVACAAVFAFVISQDGGVSAFHNRGDGTVLSDLGCCAGLSARLTLPRKG